MNRWKWLGVVSAFGLLVSVSSALGADDAVIKGKALFKGDPEKHIRKPLDTAKDENCKKSKPKGIGSYEVILNKKAEPVTIKNVLVFVKEGLGDRKFPPPPAAEETSNAVVIPKS